MKSFIITCILAGVLILSEVVLAAPTLTDIKIGDISQFDGEVLIRTQKKWIRLKQTPQPLYAADKVVTRRGRAEVEFVDGGRLRLDVDTNIGIYQRQEESVKEAKQNVTLQQINILVGKVWFNVKIRQKDRALKFKTPTMTAAIRGTQGGFGVTLDGSSQYGLSSGQAKITGKSSPLKKTSPYHIEDSLPPSDPQMDNSPFQQAVVAAVEAAELADKTELTAKTQKDNAANSDLKARALAVVTTTQAAHNRALSNHNTLLEMMTESQRFNSGNESLRQQIEDSKAALDSLRGLVTQADAILKDVVATEIKANQQTGLAKLEEIEKQANNFTRFTETAVNESFDSLTVSVFSSDFSSEVMQDSKVEGALAPESQNKEIIYEGDLETKIDPSPSQ